jgi:hypothetical protein
MSEVLDTEQRSARANKVLESVDKSLLEVGSDVDILVDVIKQNPEFSDDDLVEIVKEVWGTKEKPKVQKTKSQPKALPKSEPTKLQSKVDKKLLHFDEL